MEMVKAQGGSPTPISWGELYTALQNYVVDCAKTNPPSFYTSHHYEVCKYYALNEHTSVPDMLLMSSYVWESLNPQQQEWLQKAVDDSVATASWTSGSNGSPTAGIGSRPSLDTTSINC